MIFLSLFEVSTFDSLKIIFLLNIRIIFVLENFKTLLASERSERDTLRSVQLRIVYIYIYIIMVRAKFCSYKP